MYMTAIVSTLVAWFVGLFLDANLDFNPQGFLCLRILLPLIVMGICILKAIKDGEKKNK